MKNADFIVPVVATCFTSSVSNNNSPTNLDVVAFVKGRDSCSYNEAVRIVAKSMDQWPQAKNLYTLEK